MPRAVSIESCGQTDPLWYDSGEYGRLPGGERPDTPPGTGTPATRSRSATQRASAAGRIPDHSRWPALDVSESTGRPAPSRASAGNCLSGNQKRSRKRSRKARPPRGRDRSQERGRPTPTAPDAAVLPQARRRRTPAPRTARSVPAPTGRPRTPSNRGSPSTPGWPGRTDRDDRSGTRSRPAVRGATARRPARRDGAPPPAHDDHWRDGRPYGSAQHGATQHGKDKALWHRRFRSTARTAPGTEGCELADSGSRGRSCPGSSRLSVDPCRVPWLAASARSTAGASSGRAPPASTEVMQRVPAEEGAGTTAPPPRAPAALDWPGASIISASRSSRDRVRNRSQRQRGRDVVAGRRGPERPAVPAVVVENGLRGRPAGPTVIVMRALAVRWQLQRPAEQVVPIPPLS